jgi:hypothetical protein
MNPQDAPGAAEPLDQLPVILIPPRPNLGPEPFEKPSRVNAWPVAAAVTFVVIVLCLVLRRRARRIAVSTTAQPASGNTPADAVHALADSVRAQLVLRFGDPWRARTTEQIAESHAIAEALGAESFQMLVAFLQAVDVVKYSGQENANSDTIRAEWSNWAAHFVADAAGARSATTGK